MQCVMGIEKKKFRYKHHKVKVFFIPTREQIKFTMKLIFVLDRIPYRFKDLSEKKAEDLLYYLD